MTPEQQLTLITALVPVMLAIIALFGGVLTYLSNKQLKITKEIHVLTNSNLTKVMSDLTMANERIGELQNFIVKDKSAKDREDTRG